MTEFHATNTRNRVRELNAAFDHAREIGDWSLAHKVWLRLLHVVEIAISCAIRAQCEADAYEAKVLLYEPRRTDRPAAPLVAGHTYVFTAKTPWACMAREIRQMVHVDAGLGCSYHQEHCVPERKTICGKAVTFPVSERFTSPGWPRLSEVCPDCMTVAGDLIVKAQEAT